MSDIRKVLTVKPVCAVTFSQQLHYPEIEKKLIPILGEVEDRSAIFDFLYTEYYKEEMGDHLQKIFFSFVDSIDPGRLSGIKCQTNDLEKYWAKNGKRQVNLDPGYITGAKLVLASAKDFAHRIYIGNGIYGDVQYQFRYRQFRIQKWTFPDYQTTLALDFFHRIREKFVSEEREHEPQSQL